jgi:hypothetical protein
LGMKGDADKSQEGDEGLTNHFLWFGRLRGYLVKKVKIKNPTKPV